MRRSILIPWTAGLLGALIAMAAAHEETGKPGHHQPGPESAPPAGVRITHEQLHAPGGVPRGWKFSIPPGDPAAGKKVFVTLECYKCHSIKGESFPATPAKQADEVGPDLTGMGDHHPAEYFAESILDPNKILIEGPGYIGPDGKSKMPEYLESMTLREWVDLVAYLSSLKDPSHPHAHAGHGPKKVGETITGGYRIMLLLGGGHGPQGGSHALPTHGQPVSGPMAATGTKHLIAVIRDRETGEAVPYLPVEAELSAAGKTQQVPMQVMLGATGLHYGADVAVPPGKVRVTLQIGPTTLHQMASAPDLYRKPARVTFEWTE